jgi:hypothetical protein
MKFLRRSHIAGDPVELLAIAPQEKEKGRALDLELLIVFFARDISPESPKEDEIVL